MSTTSPVLPKVMIEETSDEGYIITLIPQSSTLMNGMPAPQGAKQVAEDFPTMIEKQAAIFGVTLPATAISAAITAAASAATSTTSAPATT